MQQNPPEIINKVDVSQGLHQKKEKYLYGKRATERNNKHGNNMSENSFIS